MVIHYTCHWYNLCHTQGRDILRRYSLLFVTALLCGDHMLIIADTGCWITAHYPCERIGLEYLWLYTAAFVDLMVYSILALVVKGFIVVDGCNMRITTREEWVHKKFVASSHGGTWRESKSIALGLLFYPVVYILTVNPKQYKCHLFTDVFCRFFPSRLSDGLNSQMQTSPSPPPHLPTRYLHLRVG